LPLGAAIGSRPVPRAASTVHEGAAACVPCTGSRAAARALLACHPFSHATKQHTAVTKKATAAANIPSPACAPRHPCADRRPTTLSLGQGARRCSSAGQAGRRSHTYCKQYERCAAPGHGKTGGRIRARAHDRRPCRRAHARRVPGAAACREL